MWVTCGRPFPGQLPSKTSPAVATTCFDWKPTQHRSAWPEVLTAERGFNPQRRSQLLVLKLAGFSLLSNDYSASATVLFRQATPTLAISSGSQRLETQSRVTTTVEYPRRAVCWKGPPRQEVFRVWRGTDGAASE